MLITTGSLYDRLLAYRLGSGCNCVLGRTWDIIYISVLYSTLTHTAHSTQYLLSR